MRIGLIGSTALAVSTARLLLKRDHEVVIVEADKERIDQLAEGLDCGFLHGDGTRPSILRELGPEGTDVLFCLTGNDQDNILAALVGRSLGFARVVPKIQEPDYEPICTELGPDRHHRGRTRPSRAIWPTTWRDGDMTELSSMLRGEVRFFPLPVGKEAPDSVGELELPSKTQAICIYRDNDFLLPDPDTRLKRGDEVLLITSSEHLPDLKARWSGNEPG